MLTHLSGVALLFSSAAVLRLLGPRTGDAGGLWDSAAGPDPDPAASPLLGLLDPEGLPQVLSTDLFALDLFHDSTGEPAPLAIMESFSHHPACNTNGAETPKV